MPNCSDASHYDRAVRLHRKISAQFRSAIARARAADKGSDQQWAAFNRCDTLYARADRVHWIANAWWIILSGGRLIH